MQTLQYNDRYRITVAEMSRSSQLAVSTWFSGWMTGGGSNLEKLQFVSAISTQIILHSRVAVYQGGEKLPDGTHELDEGVTLTLPLTESCLNDLPFSLAAWLIDAAGKENAATLETFLAAARTIGTRLKMTYARLSGGGQSGKPVTR